MFEILFTTGILLQIIQIAGSDRSQLWRYTTLGLVLLMGVLAAFLLPGILGTHTEIFAGIGMSMAFFLAPFFGLLTMKMAVIRGAWTILGLHVLLFFALPYDSLPFLWWWALYVGAGISLLSLIPKVWQYTAVRSLLYGWSLVVLLLIGVLHILPMVVAVDPDLFLALFAGMLFLSLGASGFFAIKYFSILWSTLWSFDKKHVDTFVQWLDDYTLPKSSSWRQVIPTLLVLMLIAIGYFVKLDPEQVLVCGLVLLTAFPDIKRVKSSK